MSKDYTINCIENEHILFLMIAVLLLYTCKFEPSCCHAHFVEPGDIPKWSSMQLFLLSQYTIPRSSILWIAPPPPPPTHTHTHICLVPFSPGHMVSLSRDLGLPPPPKPTTSTSIGRIDYHKFRRGFKVHPVPPNIPVSILLAYSSQYWSDHSNNTAMAWSATLTSSASETLIVQRWIFDEN